MMRLFTLLVFILFAVHQLSAQHFVFGGHLAGVASQVEGDKLNGFNDYGYTIGLIGGYVFPGGHMFKVGPQFTKFGSNHRGESFPREGQVILVEMDMLSANVLFAYAYEFGDTWTGRKKYNLTTGIRIHRLLNSDANILRSGNVGDVSIGDDDLTSFFPSLELGVGLNVSQKVTLGLSYNHGLKNILKETVVNIGKLSPLYLSLGVSYYFGLPGVDPDSK